MELALATSEQHACTPPLLEVKSGVSIEVVIPVVTWLLI